MEQIKSILADFSRAQRVRTPTVLQMEAVECGAAALGSVLAYYGKYVTLEELRAVCGVSRDGVNALSVVRAARHYGLIAKGYKQEPTALPSLKLPLIVFWNFNHFVVVEGFGKNIVYLNDPAVGPRTVTAREFDDAFTGIVLTFEPGPDFKKGGTKPSLWRELGARLRGSEAALAFVILASLMLVIPGLLVPTFTRIFVDDYLIGGMSNWLRGLLIGMVLTAGVSGALTWLQQQYLLRLQTKLALVTSSQFFWHVLRLPIEFYLQRYGGEVGSRVAINDTVAQLLSGQLATSVLNLLTILFFAAVMFTYDAGLTFIVLFFAALNVAGLRYVARARKDANQKLLQTLGRLTGTSFVGLQMIETLKAMGAESDFFERWAGQEAQVVNAEQELGVPTQFLGAMPTLLSALGTIAVLALGSLRVMNGDLTVGMLVAFQGLMLSFLAPVNQLVNLGGQLQQADGSMKRLDDVLQYPIDSELQNKVDASETAASQIPPKLSTLELKNITFGYSPLDAPLISNFNLALKPGARVALVGATGSGKSTIAKLVVGLYKPWSGDVLFDGMPRANVPRELLTDSLAHVDQDIFLFEGTVRENLSLWDKTIADADLMQAAQDAVIHHDIAARVGGYNSIVAEGGRNFSGGQRQRLEIARALVRHPTLLVLDEATSALDTLTEKEIDDNLKQRGCGCLIIAHRLSTIRDCDEILVLDNGSVVQRGTHDEMKNVDGPYRRLTQSDALESESETAQTF